MLKQARRIHCTVVVVAFMVPALLASATYADTLFMGGPSGYGDTHLYSYDTDGGGSPSIIRASETATMRNVAVDPGEGRVYWANVNNYVNPGVSFVGSSDYNGNSASYFSFEAQVMSMAYHPDQDFVYYGKVGNGGGGSFRSLIRTNADGSSPLEIASLASGAVYAIALDLNADKVYWTDRSTIWRSNLDGTASETFLTGLSVVQYLAVDGVGGELFWSTAAEVFRAPLDGSVAPVSIFTGDSWAITLSPDAAGLYYGSGSSSVMRMDTDGSNSAYVTSVYGVKCIAVVPEPVSAAILAMGGVALLRRRRKS